MLILCGTYFGPYTLAAPHMINKHKNYDKYSLYIQYFKIVHGGKLKDAFGGKKGGSSFYIL